MWLRRYFMTNLCRSPHFFSCKCTHIKVKYYASHMWSFLTFSWGLVLMWMSGVNDVTPPHKDEGPPCLLSARSCILTKELPLPSEPVKSPRRLAELQEALVINASLLPGWHESMTAQWEGRGGPIRPRPGAFDYRPPRHGKGLQQPTWGRKRISE